MTLSVWALTETRRTAVPTTAVPLAVFLALEAGADLRARARARVHARRGPTIIKRVVKRAPVQHETLCYVRRGFPRFNDQ
jgi:hypothetical protein